MNGAPLRKLGLSLRQLGKNPRALGGNPRALGQAPSQLRAAGRAPALHSRKKHSRKKYSPRQLEAWANRLLQGVQQPSTSAWRPATAGNGAGRGSKGTTAPCPRCQGWRRALFREQKQT